MTDKVWTVLDVLKWTQGKFAERGLSSARLDAEVLLAHVLSWERVKLYTHFDQPLAAAELASYRALIQKRLGGVPVAYLTGSKEFRSLTLRVDEHVLIPRPDTETLIDLALSLGGKRIVDVGTGSGAIALALKKAIPDAEVWATDASAGAAEVAAQNAAALGLAIEIVIGDLLEPVRAHAPFDLVVANLPYIPSGEIAGLEAEVRSEPVSALDGGGDGLRIIERLVAQAKPLLEGWLVLELGEGQAAKVEAMLVAAGYVEPQSARDLGGIIRVVAART